MTPAGQQGTAQLGTSSVPTRLTPTATILFMASSLSESLLLSSISLRSSCLHHTGTKQNPIFHF